MTQRPILFSGAMVRAILAGAKTQTRRVVKPTPQMVKDRTIQPWDGDPAALLGLLALTGKRCPYGQPGDRLWVRETFAHIYRDNTRPDTRRDDDVAYKADHPGLDEYAFGSWKPSIHMPRWASRITLEITSVRVERLQEISRGDSMAEGCPFPNMAAGPDPRNWYRQLWSEINGPESWPENPWVWVIEFKRQESTQ